jgi:CRP-like cAMP-binding protein/anti-anti-sigma regulatory factor
MVGTLAAERAGARSRVAVLVSALAMLAAVMVLPPLIALIPRVVIAGMLALLAVQFVDRWTVEMILKLAAGRARHWRRMALDLFVIAVVATAAIVANLVVAVGIGVVVAVVSFLFRMSRSIIRREYEGGTVQSRRTRDPELMDVLSARGAEMLVLELEGPLFFGTAEDLARRVEAARREGVRFVVLDFKRVNEVDSTGARILFQLCERMEREGKRLLLSHLPRDRAVATALHDIGLASADGAARVFHDIDRALEWAEDELIRAHAPDATAEGERALATMDVAAGLDEADRAALAALLVRRVYDKGAAVFHEGDEGRELFLIAAGVASATLRLADEGRQNRLATFSAGTVFGELALLDPGPRSATIVADEPLVCYVLTEEAFERLQKDHPTVAIAVLTNLGRELTRRLRRANRTIYQLEA